MAVREVNGVPVARAQEWGKGSCLDQGGHGFRLRDLLGNARSPVRDDRVSFTVLKALELGQRDSGARAGKAEQ